MPRNRRACFRSALRKPAGRSARQLTTSSSSFLPPIGFRGDLTPASSCLSLLGERHTKPFGASARRCGIDDTATAHRSRRAAAAVGRRTRVSLMRLQVLPRSIDRSPCWSTTCGVSTVPRALQFSAIEQAERSSVLCIDLMPKEPAGERPLRFEGTKIRREFVIKQLGPVDVASFSMQRSRLAVR